MTSSTPPPYDDGGAPPDTRIDEIEPVGRRGSRDRHDRAPNYLVRRAIAIGAVVAVLAGASVVAGRIIGGDGDDGAKTPKAADWNTIVVVADEEVRLVDPETGAVTTTYPGEEALLDAESLVTGDTLVLMNDFGRITQLDLADGAIRRSSAPDGSTLVISPENASIVLAGPPVGGDVTVVDTRDGTSFDIGDAAGLSDPLIFVDGVFVNESGRHIATADARSFQSALIDIETRSPTLLAGQVVALDDSAVVTAQRAGDQAELEFYDITGERRGSADGPSPQATMLTGDASALVVSATGAIAAVGANGTVDDIGTLVLADEATSIEVRAGHPTGGAESLVLETDAGVLVLDAAGVELARVPGELLAPVTRTTECLIAGDTRPNGFAFHLDAVTGEKLGEFPGGIVGSRSADGCTVAMLGGEPRIVKQGGDMDLGATASGSITITPDGTAYVLTTLTGERLISLQHAEGEPPETVDLAAGPVLIRFAKL